MLSLAGIGCVGKSEASRLSQWFTQVKPAIVQVRLLAANAQQMKVVAGVIVDPSGLIVLPECRVEDDSRLEVMTAGGTKFAAKVVTGASGDGVMLCRIEAGKPLAHVTLADSDSVTPGDHVFAVSCGGGELPSELTVAGGLISAKHRRHERGESLLQVDSPYGTGLPQGILFNLQGQVIGVLLPGGSVSLAAASNRVQEMLAK
jgi:S1-C subfamily serine protease